MQLSIIIVNYKTPELTLRCIESIKNTVSEACRYEIIVVDNHSQDPSETYITQIFPEVKWINNPQNEGFGRANNTGIKQAVGEYILLLNSDMIVLPGTIENCLGRIRTDKKIGALGCKLLNEDGSQQKAQFTIASLHHLLNQNLIIDKFFRLSDDMHYAIMGSFMLIPRTLLEELEGFDPDFFMYCEELELCHRIMKRGYEIKVIETEMAIHAHGASSSGDWGNRQKMLSNALLFYKIRGIGGYFLYHFISWLNLFTNFITMWFIGKSYRKGYFQTQSYYLSNMGYYFIIPLIFKQSKGHGKRLLRRG